MPQLVVPATAKVTGYTLSLIDLELPEAHEWAIRVEYRGRDLWAITRNGHCATRDGDWEWEPRNSARTDEFFARTRFDEQTALAHAHNLLDTITINGLTALDYLKRWQDEQNNPVPAAPNETPPCP